MRCGIPNAYILDITVYKMHVSLCSYCTIRILISNTLTGTCVGGYTYVFEMCCYRTLNTGDKSLKVRQEYNINIGKISLTKRNITA